PDRAWCLQLGDQFSERAGRRRAGFGQVERRLRMNVEHHALMAGSKEATNHVGPHPSEPDHSQFHPVLLVWARAPSQTGAIRGVPRPSRTLMTRASRATASASTN